MAQWRKGQSADLAGVTTVFNYYIENSLAAYSDKPLDETWAAQFMARARAFYVLASKDRILGFASLNPYRELPAFDHTATLTYFLLPEATAQGEGTRILQRLEGEARTLEISELLVHISSENATSLAFHARRGFSECGRFQRIGRKRGQCFDLVWMQKSLDLPEPVR